MPIKYLQSSVAGEEWTRAKRIIFENPTTGAFTVRFAEERAVALADGTVLSQPMGILEDSRLPEELGESFNLLNPTTGDARGAVMTYEQLHVALYSLYMATSRRAHATPQEAPYSDAEPPIDEEQPADAP